MNYQHERKKKKDRGPRPPMPTEDGRLLSKMQEYLLERQLSFDVARFNKWYPAEINGDDRIVIPCSNSEGLPYWQARAMSSDVTLRYSSPAASRDDSVVIVWPEENLTEHPVAVIVEGPADALAAATVGAIGFGMMGNSPLWEVFNFIEARLKEIAPRTIVVVPDLDTPEMGTKVVARLAGSGIKARIRMPTKKDLAEMSIKERTKLVHG